MKHFSSNIPERRGVKRMTQLELANAIGRSKDYVWKIEAGKETPSTKTLAAIARVLDGITFRANGVTCTMVPDGAEPPGGPGSGGDHDPNLVPIPGTDKYVKRPTAQLAAKHLKTTLETRQALEHLEAVGGALIDFEAGCPEARERVIVTTKEVIESVFWGSRYIDTMAQERPDVLSEAGERAYSGIVNTQARRAEHGPNQAA